MGFWRVLYRCGRTIVHLTVGELTVTGVPLFLFTFLVSSWEMDRKAERRWLGSSPCDNEQTIALRKNALRAYEEMSSELIPPGTRLRVGTQHSYFDTPPQRVRTSYIPEDRPPRESWYMLRLWTASVGTCYTHLLRSILKGSGQNKVYLVGIWPKQGAG